MKFVVGLVLYLVSSSCQHICDRTPKNAEFPKSNNKYIIEIADSPEYYSPGKFYRISLKSKPSSPVTNFFYEFILVVEPHNSEGIFQYVNTGELITIDPTVTKFTDKCRNAVVEWNNKIRKSSIEVLWKAPEDGSQCVAFKATVLESKDSWYTDDGGLTKTFCREEENIDEQTPPLATCSVCDEAKYEVAIQGMWTRNTHPKDYPSNMWETKIGEVLGASHSYNKSFWNYDTLASEGLKVLAEKGNTSLLEEELKELVKNGDVRTIIKARELAYPNITGTTYTVLRVDRDHHLVSLVAKITPSPDWIIGVANFELCTGPPNNTWEERRTFNLYPWDVGTDDGTSYNSTDTPAWPPKPIQMITSSMEEYPFYDKDGNGKQMTPIAQIRFNRQKLYEKTCEEEPEDPCAYGDWSEWSSCSTTCDNEHRTRDRQLVNPDKEEECVRNGPLELQENERCDPNSNCEHRECSNVTWSDWSQCSATCGEGVKTRKGQLPEAEEGEDGEGVSCEETVQCWMSECMETTTLGEETSPLSTLSQVVFTGPSYRKVVDCEVSEWSDWSACSATVPGTKGYQYKERHIVVHPSNGGMACPKRLRKQRKCRVSSFTDVVDCEMGEWSNWSPCSTRCGTGVQQRTRAILKKPANGGRPCEGRIEIKNCTLPVACDERD